MKLEIATFHDWQDLLPLVSAYHALENISMTDDERRRAVQPLLESSPLGKVWLVRHREETVGYIVITLGYSIELQGRDAYIDEFYLVPSSRGQGLGSHVIAAVKRELTKQEVVALHLEVAKTNSRAKGFYSSLGFIARDRYDLMSLALTP